MPSLIFKQLKANSITASVLGYKTLAATTSGSSTVYTYALNFNGQDGATPDSPITITNTDTISFNISGINYTGSTETYYVAGSESSEYIYLRTDGRIRFIDSAGEVLQVSGLSHLFTGGDHLIEMQLSPNSFELFVDGNSEGFISIAIASTTTFTTLFRRSSSVTPINTTGVIYNITFGTTASYPLQDDVAGNTNLVDAISGNNLTLINPDLSLSNFNEVPLVGNQ